MLNHREMRQVGNGLGLALCALLVAGPLAGQRGPERGARGEAMGARSGQVEALLGMRERLELTDGQIDQLNTMRETQLAERASAMEAAMRLRSDLAAGEITRDQAREQMTETRGARRAKAEGVREEIRSILTIDQREELLDLRQRAGRRGMRARGRSEIRGQGSRSPDGRARRFRRGARGPQGGGSGTGS